MKMKVSPVIIAVLALVVMIVIGFIFTMMISSENNNTEPKITEQKEKPMLDLSLDTNQENQEKVIISAYASIKDENGISSITLPDGTVVQAEQAIYEVTKNGEYTFKTTSGNGETTTVSITVDNIREVSAANPYIPEGFTHLGGTVEEGFVIEDEYGNQYVWVPVESGKLTRNTMLNSDYEETNNTASALVNSVALNYGFYIARFETSEYELEGEKVAVSMAGKIPWTNITYQDASEFSNQSASKFKYEGYNTAIMNSFAWDTVLNWVDQKVQNYSSNISYGNYSGSIYPTGETASDIVNNICDIAGNVREWTTEIYKAANDSDSKKKENNNNVIYRVVRGGSANLSRTPASHIGYPENTSDTYWGFRMILYK